MGLFNFGKKIEDVKKPACACDAPLAGTVEESCCCLEVL